MGRRIGVVALAVCALILSFMGGEGGIGFDYSVVNGFVTVSASTSVAAIVGAAGTWLAYGISLEGGSRSTVETTAGNWSRGFAWFTDLYLGLVATTSILTLVPLWREASLRGSFEWSFARHDATSVDWALGTGLVIVQFLALALYWAIPLRTTGQTIGQLIFGTRVVSLHAEGRPAWTRALLRGLMQPFAMFWWLASLFSPKGEFLHDRVGQVRVVRAGGTLPMS